MFFYLESCASLTSNTDIWLVASWYAGFMEIGRAVAANMLCLFSPQGLEVCLALCRTKLQMGGISFFSSPLKF